MKPLHPINLPWQGSPCQSTLPDCAAQHPFSEYEFYVSHGALAFPKLVFTTCILINFGIDEATLLATMLPHALFLDLGTNKLHVFSKKKKNDHDV